MNVDDPLLRRYYQWSISLRYRQLPIGIASLAQPVRESGRGQRGGDATAGQKPSAEHGVTSASAEEKGKLALELLLLSPGKSSPTEADVSAPSIPAC
jgi:hypothetical protein